MGSLWTDTTDRPRFSKLDKDIRTDVLIIGGGMAGILCAHALRQAGVSCVVAEANRIGSGITENTTAKITAQHGLIYHKLEKRYGLEAAGRYLQANEAAVVRFRELCGTLDCDFENKDSFVYSMDDRSILERELSTLSRLHSGAGFAEPTALPFSTAGAVRFPDQAQFHPLKFLYAICQELPVYENARVQELKGRVAITDGGRITADSILVATHFPFLNKHGMYFLKLYQHRSYCLALENAPDVSGMYVDEQENGLSFRNAGGLLLLGGGSHRTGKPGGSYRELTDFARRYYPDARIRTRWATQDCMSLDGIPYIGQYSSRTRGLYVATGFNKWGMTSSMVAAALLTDLILHGERQPLFSPSRTMLHRQLGINTLEAVTHLLLPAPKRCPHMGCGLKWNRQEHSWDCPCHGSRFDAEGTLLNNPATGNLKK